MLKQCFTLYCSFLLIAESQFMKDLSFKTLAKITIVLIFATLSVYILVVGKGILVPLTISFFIAFLLIPLNDFLERIRFPRPLAAISSILIFIIGVSAILTIVAARVKNFTDDLDKISEKLNDLLSKLPPSISQYASNYSLENILAMAQNHMGTIFTSLSGFFSSFSVLILIPIYVALILIYRDHLKEFVYRLFRQSSTSAELDASQKPIKIKELISKIRKVIQKYMTGVFYVMCILFVLYSIALFSLGIQHAFLFAALAAVLNIIPFVGPFIGSALPILFAFVTKDSLFYPLAVFGIFVLIQSIEGNFLTPKIVGNNVSLNPLITLIALIVGASIWGIIGMILFIPLMAILREIFQVIDDMEPYAYLMGNPEEDIEKPNFFTHLYRKIKTKFF